MSKNKTKAELLAENKMLRSYQLFDSIAVVANNFIKWSGLVAIAVCGYLTVNALAGKETAADIGIKIFGDIRLSEVFGGLFGVCGVAYGIRERSLRKRKTEHLAARASAKETERDPWPIIE